ncbi:MAG: DUF2203 domain-containing protein [Planctomycetales bacterium]|nr:DUF2203 domain-containing protein [Planctomycetales bacterium]
MQDNSTAQNTAKRFTLAEANAMLPLIRSIVSDIREVFRSVTGRRSDLHRLLRRNARTTGQAYADEMAESRADLNEEYDRIWFYREELESLGAFLRHPEEGHIEFPTIIDDREGFLSWHAGEDKIMYWRQDGMPLNTRQPIPVVEHLN